MTIEFTVSPTRIPKNGDSWDGKYLVSLDEAFGGIVQGVNRVGSATYEDLTYSIFLEVTSNEMLELYLVSGDVKDFVPVKWGGKRNFLGSFYLEKIVSSYDFTEEYPDSEKVWNEHIRIISKKSKGLISLLIETGINLLKQIGGLHHLRLNNDGQKYFKNRFVNLH